MIRMRYQNEIIPAAIFNNKVQRSLKSNISKVKVYCFLSVPFNQKRKITKKQITKTIMRVAFRTQ